MNCRTFSCGFRPRGGAWPRVADHAPPGYPLATSIPPEIATATAELAIDLLRTGKMPGGPALQMVMLGDSNQMFYPSVPDALPRHVRKLIEPQAAPTLGEMTVTKITMVPGVGRLKRAAAAVLGVRRLATVKNRCQLSTEKSA